MNGYFGIGLVSPKFKHNVGSVFRVCDAYDCSFVAVTNKRVKVTNNSADTTGARKRIPLFRVEDILDTLPHDCVPVAVEFIPNIAKSLVDYIHPQKAFYIFGPEDGTLGKNTLDRCRDVVYLPTNI